MNEIKNEFKELYIGIDDVYMVTLSKENELVCYTKKLPETRTLPYEYKGLLVLVIESAPISTF